MDSNYSVASSTQIFQVKYRWKTARRPGLPRLQVQHPPEGSAPGAVSEPLRTHGRSGLKCDFTDLKSFLKEHIQENQEMNRNE